jgi:hypothetical protein
LKNLASWASVKRTESVARRGFFLRSTYRRELFAQKQILGGERR